MLCFADAIRTSHNPVSPAFVAACDKLGVMLMEEAFDCWDTGEVVNIVQLARRSSCVVP